MQDVDTKHGLFTWFGAVDESMHDHVVTSLLTLSATRHKKLTFVLSTHGGDAHVGFALYDLIKGNAKPVRIVINGCCGSAGTLILQAGSERLIFPHSFLLIHFGSQGGTSQSEFDFDRRQHTKWVELMAEATGGKTSLHDMTQMHKGETFLTANEALLHGLVDRVVTSIRTNEGKSK
jgi:ATP-dependent protease ClpP protease subunit